MNDFSRRMHQKILTIEWKHFGRCENILCFNGQKISLLQQYLPNIKQSKQSTTQHYFEILKFNFMEKIPLIKFVSPPGPLIVFAEWTFPKQIISLRIFQAGLDSKFYHGTRSSFRVAKGYRTFL